VMTANSLQWNNYTGEHQPLLDWFNNGTGGNFTGINFGYPFPANTSGIHVLTDKLWINELVSINLFTLLGVGPDQDICPLIVLDADTMSHDDNVLFNYLIDGVQEWLLNGSIVDRSWFPSYLLDFRIYYSSYVNLESFGRDNITVFGFGVTNCSRETYWQQTDSFLYSYYTTQKKYQVTLQVENNISTSHYYDVNWYVGYPANKVVDPATLTVYDLDNLCYLTLGQHYDASNAGVWMSFVRLNMSEVRTFTFTIYSWNATIGMGTAIAYANSYVQSAIGSTDYLKAVPTWTNNYGRVYQGAVFIQLSFADGKQRYIDPSDVQVYDRVAGAFLQPWQFVVNGGLIIIDYAIVNVGTVQDYDVYFHLDMTGSSGFNINDTAILIGGVAVSWLMLLIIIVVALGVAAYLKDNKVLGYAAVIAGAFTAVIWIFSMSGGIP
jgi:hypothetical protein